MIAHVDSLTLAIILDQNCRANGMYDFSDNQYFLFSFRKYIVRVSVLLRHFKSNKELHCYILVHRRIAVVVMVKLREK